MVVAKVLMSVFSTNLIKTIFQVPQIDLVEFVKNIFPFDDAESSKSTKIMNTLLKIHITATIIPLQVEKRCLVMFEYTATRERNN